MSDDKTHLPVMYRDAHGQELGSTARVLEASGKDIERFSSGKICGNCDHFEPGHVAAEMTRQDFMQKLVREYEWNPEHIAGCVSDEAGMCRENPGMVTSQFTAGHNCPAWREDRGRLKRATKPEEAQAWIEQRRKMQRLHKERMDKRRAEFERTQGIVSRKGRR